MKQHQFVGLVIAAMVGSALSAAPPPAGLFKSMLACRTVQEPTARLACFDRQAAALDSASAKGDVAVIDRESIRQARKQDFGRHSEKPVIPLGTKDVEQIDVVVRSATRNSDNGWLLTMTDGSRWTQTDATAIGRFPVAGSKVRIKRAALGSYKMFIDGGPAIKARRIG